MSDFLGRLVQRALGSVPAVRPRFASRYEPVAAGEFPLMMEAASLKDRESQRKFDTDGARDSSTRPAARQPSVADPNVAASPALSHRAATDSPEAHASMAHGLAIHGSGSGNEPAPAVPPHALAVSQPHRLPPTPSAVASLAPDRAPAGVPERDARPAPAEDHEEALRATTAKRHGPVSSGELSRPAVRTATPTELESATLSSRGEPGPRRNSDRSGSRMLRPAIQVTPVVGSQPTDIDHDRTAATADASNSPDVHISIGCVEIRTLTPPVASHRNGTPAPRLSLDEYLRRNTQTAR